VEGQEKSKRKEEKPIIKNNNKRIIIRNGKVNGVRGGRMFLKWSVKGGRGGGEKG